VVDGTGARYLFRRFERGGYPGESVDLGFVSSHADLKATHFEPLDTSLAARAAFWQPADDLLESLEQPQ
jgi:hypothetical protein